jgi:hypothetical protein
MSWLQQKHKNLWQATLFQAQLLANFEAVVAFKEGRKFLSWEPL